MRTLGEILANIIPSLLGLVAFLTGIGVFAILSPWILSTEDGRKLVKDNLKELADQFPIIIKIAAKIYPFVFALELLAVAIVLFIPVMIFWHKEFKRVDKTYPTKEEVREYLKREGIK